MSNRALLHLTKLEEFASWAVAHGWARRATKGASEVLRLSRGDVTVMYYERAGTDHATSFDEGTVLVRKWLRDKQARKGT